MGRVWKPYSVEAFIEGPWVSELKSFAEQVEDLNQKRNAKFTDKRKQEDLNDLRKKFGL